MAKELTQRFDAVFAYNQASFQQCLMSWPERTTEQLCLRLIQKMRPRAKALGARLGGDETVGLEVVQRVVALTVETLAGRLQAWRVMHSSVFRLDDVTAYQTEHLAVKLQAETEHVLSQLAVGEL